MRSTENRSVLPLVIHFRIHISKIQIAPSIAQVLRILEKSIDESRAARNTCIPAAQPFGPDSMIDHPFSISRTNPFWILHEKAEHKTLDNILHWLDEFEKRRGRLLSCTAFRQRGSITIDRVIPAASYLYASLYIPNNIIRPPVHDHAGHSR